MKKFIVEQVLPGAGNLTTEELQTLSQTSCEAMNELWKPYHWIQSFITDDKIYCIHIADSEEVVRKHASLGRFPINTIAEVKAMMDPTTGNHC